MYTFFKRKFNQLGTFYLKVKGKIKGILLDWKTPNEKKIHTKGLSKDPFFYFGVMSFVLFGFLFFSSPSLAEPNYVDNNNIIFFNSFFKNTDNLTSSDLFSSQNKELALETPDLKIIQDNSLTAVSTPSTLTTQTLGDIFGGQDQSRKEVIEHTVVLGDTVTSVANLYNITPETVAWANDITKNTTLKVGQTLTILPVSGILYIVKNGDTLDQIAKTYKVTTDDIITFNELGDGKIFVGDSLILENAKMPVAVVRPPLPIQIALPNSFFIFPVLKGLITQGLHYYNAIDVANVCGTPIYAAASGTVQRAVGDGGWHLGEGNHITIAHSNGTITYYGHLMSLFVRSGDVVNTGDRIGLMGRTGKTTGCHVHFQVIGAANPLARYPVGTTIDANNLR